ncbi:DMT family transporter [Mycolicibacterium smegmatis]|uniref:DMT family transporter n=1 Tax=Mycolicibacterium smegmatis TaxID=1772 RepID=UPI0020A31376|nr:DMT family transporter [Mycolicibacterium smegmatis]MCP2625314.1 DMT family transporter [Mycolicibacterium smegmatis]MCP2626083.1 DMT family transporter [Mycolicibacterium smegmatis]
MLGNSIAVLLALCAAIFMAVGIVVRQRATLDVPAGKGVSTVMLRTLLRRKLWWAGTISAVMGYGFQALALGFGSLLLVQPVLVSALLFALPLSARLAHRTVSRADWMWALLLTGALTVFVLLARTSTGTYSVSVSTTVTVAVVCTSVVALCVVLATRSSNWRRAVLLAAAVGVMFGVVAVLTKIVMHMVADGDVLATFTTPALYLVVVLGVLATLLQQSAFHAGSLQTSEPTMLVLEPVVAVLLGSVVLGEHLSIAGWQPVALTLAIAAMIAATIALGRDEGAYEETLEAEMEAKTVTG